LRTAAPDRRPHTAPDLLPVAYPRSREHELTFAAAPQQLTAKTGSGDVDIAVPDDDTYQVVVETSVGDTEIRVRQDPGATRTIGVQTSRGDVRIRYAS
jgi:hypothetical protein